MIGLYVHIPFCKRKCPYCDFFSVCADAQDHVRYAETLCRHIRIASEKYPQKADTLYFGGGTPSLIGETLISDILHTAKDNFGLDDAEITLEVNPEKRDIDFDKLRKSGVNRISVGLQSANDDELQQLGRLHNVSDAKHCISAAKSAGFDNISLDLMLATPLQTKDSLKRSVDFCAEQGASHISAYLLKIEPDTPFDNRPDKDLLCDDDRQAEFYLYASELIASCGYEQYEISNFAKQGFEGKHNLKYWHDEEYLGFGAAAHSFIGGRRFYCGRSFEEFYARSFTDDGLGGSEEEFLMLGLRLSEGITHQRYRQRFQKDIPDHILQKAKRLIPSGLLTVTDSGIALTKQGFLLSNAVIAKLLS